MSFPSWPLRFLQRLFFWTMFHVKQNALLFENGMSYADFFRMFHVKHSAIARDSGENNGMRFFSKKRGFGLKYTENML